MQCLTSSHFIFYEIDKFFNVINNFVSVTFSLSSYLFYRIWTVQQSASTFDFRPYPMFDFEDIGLESWTRKRERREVWVNVLIRNLMTRDDVCDAPLWYIWRHHASCQSQPDKYSKNRPRAQVAPQGILISLNMSASLISDNLE